VGSFPKTRSPYGCEDLIGNVAEWCQMTDGEDYGHLPTARPDVQPPAPGQQEYAAVRGSAYMRSCLHRMVAARRRRLSVTRRNHWTGFRPAFLAACRPALG
jgi:formylglycine-generating enzyme required for sulfatase activity